MNDLRQAVRQLFRRPVFSLTAIALLGIAIGANTTVYTVVRGVLFRPLPFPEPERLVTVWLTFPQWREREVLSRFWDHIELSWPEYQRLRDHSRTLAGTGAYRTDDAILSGFERAERIVVGVADAGLAPTLGVRMLGGRWFSEDEGAKGGPPAAVLSHTLWRTRFGADTGVIGRPIRINDREFTIVGVLPRNASLPGDGTAEPPVWTSLGSADLEFTEGNHVLRTVARLASGVTVEDAEAETVSLLRGDASPESRGGRLVPRQEEVAGDVRPGLLLFWGAVVLMLLVAATNLASLLVSRGAERDRELAVRQALGAGRWRLARLILLEGVVLSAAGASLGVLVSWLGLDGLMALAGDRLPQASSVRIDASVLGFSLLLALGTGLGFGAAPAWLAARRTVGDRMRREVVNAGRSGQVQRLLVAAQIAVTVVLLVAAGLLARTLLSLSSLDRGFQAKGLLTFTLEAREGRYPDDEDAQAFIQRVRTSVAALPGVRSVEETSVLPLSGESSSNSIWAASWGAEVGRKPELERRVVSPGYLAAIGVPLLAGRALDRSDGGEFDRVALLSRAAADRLWGAADPIGDRVEMNRTQWTVVGIVGDLRDRALDAEPVPTIYVPAAQWPRRTRTFLVAGGVLARDLAQGIRTAVQRIDADVPVTDLTTTDEIISRSLSVQRVRAGLMAAFALLTLLVSAAGLYGVTAHRVIRRTREIGLRMALGAVSSRVVRLVVGEAIGVTLLGAAIGLVLAVPAAIALRALLYGVHPFDPLIVGATLFILLIVAGLAAMLPARRATRIDPMEALRHE